MKKDVAAQVRLAGDDWTTFRTACKGQGVTASTVIRDLCAAAIPYMAAHCPKGRWIAPSLVPYGSAGVIQVANGHGNKQVVKSRRKA